MAMPANKGKSIVRRKAPQPVEHTTFVAAGSEQPEPSMKKLKELKRPEPQRARFTISAENAALARYLMYPATYARVEYITRQRVRATGGVYYGTAVRVVFLTLECR